MDEPSNAPGTPDRNPEASTSGRIQDADQPFATGPDAPASPAAARKQPLWTSFLTPAAILIGAGIIAGSIWWSRDDGDGAPALAAEVADTNGAVSAAPTAAGATGQTLLTVFTDYANSLGLNTSQFQTCLTKQANVDLITAQYQRGTSLGVTGTPTFFINNKMIVGAQPEAIFDEVIQAEIDGSPTSLDGYSANILALASTTPPRFAILPQAPDTSDAVFEGGDAGAKVVIAEFSDFQCPFCKRWSEQTLPALRQKFLGKGVSLAFLHYPITQIHPNAGNASVAAICAGEQGKFWEMHDLLFATQNAWEQLN